MTRHSHLALESGADVAAQWPFRVPNTAILHCQPQCRYSRIALQLLRAGDADSFSEWAMAGQAPASMGVVCPKRLPPSIRSARALGLTSRSKAAPDVIESRALSLPARARNAVGDRSDQRT